MRAKSVKESIQVPFSNKNRNAPISGSYPLSKIQYEDADKRKMGFREDSDPIDDMGIGMRHQISQWMKEIGEEDTDDNALIQAARYGKLDFVKYLVKKGADIHADDDLALQLASENGHLEVVKYLIEQGANIHAEDDWSLQLSSRNGHLEVVKYLVEQGANIHAVNGASLQWASHNGRLEVVKYLIEQGADIHADDDLALRWASRNGHLEVVKYLKSQMKKQKKVVKESLTEAFQEDSDPIEDMGIGMRHLISKWMEEIGVRDTDDNALVEAAKHGKLDFVKYLVKKGADIHADDDLALQLASQDGHLEIVKFLLENGADIHARNDYALKWASGKGHLEVVKYLVEQGADIHARDDLALRWASENGHLEVVKYLVEQGANIHADEDAALRYASYYGRLEVVKYLVENGADIYTENEWALRYAIYYGYLEVVKYLESKMGINESLIEAFQEDSDPITDMGIGMRPRISQWMKEIGKEDTDDNALIQAARYGKLDFVKYLVQKGADIHAFSDGALRWASNNGHLEVVKFLVGKGADIHANHDYALRWASYNEHLEVVKYLESQMKKDKIVKESLFEKFIEDSDPIKDMGIGNPFRAGNIIKSKPNKFIKATKHHRNLILGSNNPYVSNRDYYGLIVKDTYKGGKLQLFILFFSNYEDMIKNDLPYINTLTFPEIDKDYDVIKGEYTIEKWNEYFTIQK